MPYWRWQERASQRCSPNLFDRFVPGALAPGFFFSLALALPGNTPAAPRLKRAPISPQAWVCFAAILTGDGDRSGRSSSLTAPVHRSLSADFGAAGVQPHRFSRHGFGRSGTATLHLGGGRGPAAAHLQPHAHPPGRRLRAAPFGRTVVAAADRDPSAPRHPAP